MADMETRVQRGVRFLDLNFPGWRDEVDTNRLQMNLPECCIIGQLFGGNYSEGLEALEAGDPEELGFDTFPTEGDSPAETYAALTKMWIEEVKKGEK